MHFRTGINSRYTDRCRTRYFIIQISMGVAFLVDRIRGIDTRWTTQICVRLCIASFLNYTLSAIMFRIQYIPFVEGLQNDLLSSTLVRTELSKMRKMYELWPAHTHPAIYLAYTVFVYWIMEYYLSPSLLPFFVARPVDDSKSSEDCATEKCLSTSLVSRLFIAFILSLFIFSSTLHMQRIGEMHIFVILMNYAHTLISVLLTTTVMFSYRLDTSGDKSTSRNERKIKSD
ncbi:hypothetical protein Tcan_10118 [Toxocara canis]|uniref:Uncharacterized protein n=1 Tax=Toxocara canis TaxID=6265 RepID=A0A0B2VQ26_TOXCA|nr:hypothetical protein Tcan_10118 [Toxocara canis]